MEDHYGELAALATAFFWTATAMFFEVASKKIGSLSVNMLRLLLAMIFLSLFSWVYRGVAFPLDAGQHNWIWLSVSGLVGFVFGDYFLFRAYAMISSRVSMLIMTLVPPITALIGFFLLNEVLSWLSLLGMFLTMSGIIITIFNRSNGKRKLRFSYPLKGLLFAFAGAIGQATGLVLSKYGMQQYDPFAATQIRIIAAIIGFALIIVILGKMHLIRKALNNKQGLITTAGGSFFGPFLGVSFSLLAVRMTETGIASTIMAIVPVLIIIPSVLIFKQKVTLLEIIGAFISVGGVTLFFV